MAGKDDTGPGKTAADARHDRLKAALKANMGRRKAQTRARTGAAQTKSPKGTEQKETD